MVPDPIRSIEMPSGPIIIASADIGMAGVIGGIPLADSRRAARTRVVVSGFFTVSDMSMPGIESDADISGFGRGLDALSFFGIGIGICAAASDAEPARSKMMQAGWRMRGI